MPWSYSHGVHTSATRVGFKLATALLHPRINGLRDQYRQHRGRPAKLIPNLSNPAFLFVLIPDRKTLQAGPNRTHEAWHAWLGHVGTHYQPLTRL